MRTLGWRCALGVFGWCGALGVFGWCGALGVFGWCGALGVFGWCGALGVFGWCGALGTLGGYGALGDRWVKRGSVLGQILPRRSGVPAAAVGRGTWLPRALDQPGQVQGRVARVWMMQAVQ